MGKTVVYNEQVADYINNVCRGKPQHTGLIIGTSTPQRLAVAHLTPTPKREVLDHSPKAGSDVTTDKKKKKKAQATASNKEELIDEAWICQHAKQVNRMLPGGLDVLGIFVYAPTDTYAKVLPSVRQVMFSSFKSLSQDQQLGLCSESGERIQLHICSVTQKVTCRSIDISDYKSTAKPADWKQVGTLQWNQLDTGFWLDQWIPVSKDQSKQSLLRQILSGLAPIYASILSGTMLFNDQLRPKDELLQSPAEGSAKKGKQSAKQTTQEIQKFKVDLFLPLAENNNIPEPQIMECGASMEVFGTIHCRAFLHSKATIQEAIQVVQQDIIRSITARCEIQCEEMLLIEEEQEDPSLVHELPRRVFAFLPGQQISVCDYVYGGDSAKDSLDAFQELLHLQLCQEDIDTSCEQSPASHDIDDQELEERLSEAGEQVMEAISNSRNIIVPIASATILAVAAGISYFFLQDSI